MGNHPGTKWDRPGPGPDQCDNCGDQVAGEACIEASRTSTLADPSAASSWNRDHYRKHRTARSIKHTDKNPATLDTVPTTAWPATCPPASQSPARTDLQTSLPNVLLNSARFPQEDGARFDLVTMVATLHHTPLISGIRAAREAVGPPTM